MKARIIQFALGALVTSLVLNQANGEQYVRHVNGREVIVHTNPAPVIVHRLLPPYLGKHVTEREAQKGRLPRAQRR